jgi:predicted AAA+ superfamily ATPase
MGRGVPKNGFRMTKKRRAHMAAGFVKDFAVAKTVLPVKVETEAEIEQKLRERFAALDTMTQASVNGQTKAVVVSGPAGVGKSHGVLKILEKNSSRCYFNVISGYVRPTGLYKALHEFRHKNSVLVFDDADSIFNDEVSLNFLKKACDTSKKRILSYLAESKMEDEDGERLPRNFEFEGTIIFITNLDFEEMIARGSKNAPHFEALVSRSHYLDLGMKSVDDYVVRIKQVVRDGAMLRTAGFSAEEEATIIAYVVENKNKLRELSLRMVLKLSSLMRIDSKNWQSLAKATCLKQGV